MLSQEMAWFDRKDNGVGALCAKLSGEAASVQGVSSSCSLRQTLLKLSNKFCLF
jgi:hypothetical protein